MGKTSLIKPRPELSGALELPAPPPGPVRAWYRFWFTPTEALGLHIVRVLAGLLWLAWLLPLAGDVETLFGLNGWLDAQAFKDAARLPEGTPHPIHWSVVYLCGSNIALLTAVFWLAITTWVLFTLGIAVRVTAVLSWVFVASFTASPAVVADADGLLLILAFYLMFGYLLLGLRDPDQAPLWRCLGPRGAWFLGRSDAVGGASRPSVAANLALRLAQVHVALWMLVHGLHKLQSGDWWSGTALWYPLNPPMEQVAGQVGSPAEIEAQLGWLGVAAYAVLAWQIGFPAFAWRRRWRPILLGGAVAGWLGSALLYQTPVYGPALGIACLTFVSAEEWQRLARIPGLRRILPRLTAEAESIGPSTAKRENAPASLA